MKRIIYSFVSACFLLSSCSMDETPQASVDKDTVFRTEKGLETYSYSFYNMLPSVSDGFRQDAMCDYGAVTSFDNFIREGAYSAELSSGWSWSDLRNINYFIENCTNEAVDESVRNNYIGLARFFRAYFYYEMVVRSTFRRCALDRPYVRCGRRVAVCSPRFADYRHGSCVGRPGLRL